MASLNRVQLIGFLGADPEIRYMNNGTGDAVASVRIATTESWKDKASGEKKEETEWHRVVFFGKLAEIVGEYLKKGSPVYVEGRIKTQKWINKEGEDRYSTEISADRMQMLGANQKKSKSEDEPVAQTPENPKQGGFDDFKDDIPF